VTDTHHAGHGVSGVHDIDLVDYVALIGEDELWDHDMESFDVGPAEVLLVKVDGVINAFDGICPHQSTSLAEGSLEGRILTCHAHEWQFDVMTGEGVNPRTACLGRHDVRIIDGVVHVSRRRISRPRG
jgi:nitrite reductase/ring-hydroxylating ferredoxin subunit